MEDSPLDEPGALALEAGRGGGRQRHGERRGLRRVLEGYEGFRRDEPGVREFLRQASAGAGGDAGLGSRGALPVCLKDRVAGTPAGEVCTGQGGSLDGT